MNPHVRLLVGGWTVGWSVCHNFPEMHGSFTLHAPIRALVINCFFAEVTPERLHQHRRASGGNIRNSRQREGQTVLNS